MKKYGNAIIYLQTETNITLYLFQQKKNMTIFIVKASDDDERRTWAR
jgi:hypothetical protein